MHLLLHLKEGRKGRKGKGRETRREERAEPGKVDGVGLNESQASREKGPLRTYFYSPVKDQRQRPHKPPHFVFLEASAGTGAQSLTQCPGYLHRSPFLHP